METLHLIYISQFIYFFTADFPQGFDWLPFIYLKYFFSLHQGGLEEKQGGFNWFKWWETQSYTDIADKASLSWVLRLYEIVVHS